MPKKRKPGKDDYHESGDRLAIIQENLEDYVKNSLAVRSDKKLVKAIDKIQAKLCNIYTKLALKM